ncbi:amino acid ABC transporter substrate-binding protein [Allorhizobium ampelinum]|uniref:amino acid ABC transporter substrate-binding protein n=1 Tax=Allorhizobium ampelinum TaxID=3025782 RepID=UPI001F35F964|nr:amino acid ABC transporter substrate-binding protein [Allorhizobium ampelinum]
MAGEATLDKIARTGVIALGYRQAEPPFSYKTPSGEIIGFSMDLCRHVAADIAKHLKRDDLKIEYVLATPATRFVLVKNGTIDIECAATTNNAERRRTVEFSYPDFLTATQFVSRRSDDITSIEDLTGRSVTSASGTVNIDQLNAINREKKLSIAVIATKTNEEAFNLVTSERAHAFVMDGILLAAMIAQSDDPSKYVLSEEMLSKPEPYGLMLRKDDGAFKDVVNGSLRKLFMSPEMDAIYAKWFTSPIPPSGMNLNLPMSNVLKKAYADPVEYKD